MLDDLVKRKETETMSRIAASKEKDISAPSSKVQAICKMARFDDDILRPAIPVRVVLFGNTICVYQFDASHRSPNKEEKNNKEKKKNHSRSGSDDSSNEEDTEDSDDATTIITAEKLIGKINCKTVMSTSEKLSKYHRHTDPTKRHAPVRGKCLVLRCKDDLPLFMEDPVLQMARQQARQQEEQEEEEKQQQQQERERHHKGHHSYHNRQKHEHQRDNPFLDATFSVVSSLVSYRRHEGNSANEDGYDDCLSSWTAVVFKFPTRRELERWFNLLEATPQSDEWRGFIKRLPQLDVFNVVVARLFFENTRTSELRDLLIGKLRRKLHKVSRRLPKHMQGEILLDRLELGGEIPLISNVSDPTVATSGELELDFDLLYRGGLTLTLRFSITYRSVRVPDILFNIKMLELANRMRLSVGPPPSNKLWIGSSRTPQLRLEFTQEVASHDGLLHAVLNLIPDMSKVMTNIVKVKLFEDMILPSMDDFPLPCLSYSPPSSEPDSPTVDDTRSTSMITSTLLESNKGEEEKVNPPPNNSKIYETTEQVTEQSVTTVKQNINTTEEVKTILKTVNSTETLETVPSFSSSTPKEQSLSFEMDEDETTSVVSSRISSNMVPGSSVSEPWRRTATSRAKKFVKWIKIETKSLSKKGKEE
ncbi:uncharacterized protein TM35_000321940 [Trypanosoma theileri]|uniref:SMP-LTD domain-containing protein n=1 Tax=Trypanosoma theileri TaxID=67003 RepID=A0A1X0NNZ4_9TRYP|nr:uncharacterized protein TM35_000321940 [Trypanosoma theileri]ORC85879.1 hypothetical protein TM35_000321940 [Trypanosoma theileri]